MPLTRRMFLYRTFVVGPMAMGVWIEADPAHARGGPQCSLPVPPDALRFVPGEGKIRERPSASELASPARAAELRRFRDAVGAIRALDPGDVVGWDRQIAQHCVQCAPSNGDNIHFDWQFLPWHRAYLYFLERVLRSLVGDDDLRLPYWDWENTRSRTLPEAYAPPDQPLYWPRRQLTGPAWPLSDEEVDVQPLLAIPNADVFLGTPTQRRPVPATFSGPHANVHNAFDPGDMADLQYSPRDPVFYAHHGNIDRLWASWTHAGHANPDFGDAKVFFYDETRRWRYVLLNDLRDETRLGYRYSSLMTPTVPTGQLRQLALGPVDTRMTLPSAAVTSPSGPGPSYLIVENIENLETLPGDTLRYGIFVGQPPVGADAASVPGYLGKASRVASDEHDHAGPLSAALNVTGKLGAFTGETTTAIELTVAPLDGTGKTTGPGIPLVADNVSLLG